MEGLFVNVNVFDEDDAPVTVAPPLDGIALWSILEEVTISSGGCGIKSSGSIRAIVNSEQEHSD